MARIAANAARFSARLELEGARKTPTTLSLAEDGQSLEPVGQRPTAIPRLPGHPGGCNHDAQQHDSRCPRPYQKAKVFAGLGGHSC